MRRRVERAIERAGRSWGWWLVAALALIGAIGLLDGGFDIVSLELARTAEDVRRVIATRTVSQARLVASVLADYPFLIAYAGALAGGSVWVGDRLPSVWPRLAGWGMAYAAVWAAILDSLENVGLVIELSAPDAIGDGLAGATAAIATVKWALVLPPLAWVPLGVLGVAFTRGVAAQAGLGDHRPGPAD